MGILTKMLGTKTFLLLTLSVLGYSMPQPELRIIIHLHQDNFQPGPVGNRIVSASKQRGPSYDLGPVSYDFGSVMTSYPRRYEGGQDYSDDDADTVDQDVIPNKDVIPNEDEIPNGNVKPMMGEVEYEVGSGSGDQSGGTKVVEAGDDYSDQRIPEYYGAAKSNGKLKKIKKGNQVKTQQGNDYKSFDLQAWAIRQMGIDRANGGKSRY